MAYYADFVNKFNNLLDACQNDDLQIVNESLKDFDFGLIYNAEHKTDEKLLSAACQNGHLKIVQLLMNSPYSSKYINTPANIFNALSYSISKEQLHIISYLMNEPTLNRSPNFYEQFDWPLSKATSYDSLELFKTLLNLEYPQNSTKFLLEQQNKLTFACAEQHYKIIKYVVNNPKLKEYVDLENWFDIAATYKNQNLLNFFIFDLKIDYTEKIQSFIKEHELEYVKQLFETRELTEELNSELLSNKKNIKKHKV